MKERSIRRHERERMKTKALRLIGRFHKGMRFYSGKWADNIKKCSCWSCSFKSIEKHKEYKTLRRQNPQEEEIFHD